MRRLHIFGYIALCAIWGSTWLAVHMVVQDLPPFLAAAARFSAAAIFLLIWVVIRKPAWPRGEREWNAILVPAICHIIADRCVVFRHAAHRRTAHAAHDASQSSTSMRTGNADSIRCAPAPSLYGPAFWKPRFLGWSCGAVVHGLQRMVGGICQAAPA